MSAVQQQSSPHQQRARQVNNQVDGAGDQILAAHFAGSGSSSAAAAQRAMLVDPTLQHLGARTGGGDSSGANSNPSTSTSVTAPRKSRTSQGGDGFNRGSRWANAPSDRTLKQYDDTMLTVRKWLLAAHPSLADAFDSVNERTLDAMLLYLDHAVDRGLSYNTVSRANSAMMAFFKFRLGRRREEWDAILDDRQRWREGNPCYSSRYRAKYHSISKEDLFRRRNAAIHKDQEVGSSQPLLYPHIDRLLPFLWEQGDRHNKGSLVSTTAGI